MAITGGSLTNAPANDRRTWPLRLRFRVRPVTLWWMLSYLVPVHRAMVPWYHGHVRVSVVYEELPPTMPLWDSLMQSLGRVGKRRCEALV